MKKFGSSIVGLISLGIIIIQRITQLSTHREYSNWVFCFFLLTLYIELIVGELRKRRRLWTIYPLMIAGCYAGFFYYYTNRWNDVFYAILVTVVLFAISILIFCKTCVPNDNYSIPSMKEIWKYFSVGTFNQQLDEQYPARRANILSIYGSIVFVAVQICLTYFQYPILKAVFLLFFSVMFVIISHMKYKEMKIAKERAAFDVLMVLIAEVHCYHFGDRWINFYLIMIEVFMWAPYTLSAFTDMGYDEVEIRRGYEE